MARNLMTLSCRHLKHQGKSALCFQETGTFPFYGCMWNIKAALAVSSRSTPTQASLSVRELMRLSSLSSFVWINCSDPCPSCE